MATVVKKSELKAEVIELADLILVHDLKKPSLTKGMSFKTDLNQRELQACVDYLRVGLRYILFENEALRRENEVLKRDN
jgi:hypothetical protein